MTVSFYDLAFRFVPCFAVDDPDCYVDYDYA